MNVSELVSLGAATDAFPQMVGPEDIVCVAIRIGHEVMFFKPGVRISILKLNFEMITVNDYLRSGVKIPGR